METQQNRATFSEIDFGETVDSPIIRFILAQDLNGRLIRIPYSSSQTRVGTLIENYLAVTSYKHEPGTEPCFQILQGTFEGQIAVKEYKISTMGLNTEKVCFRVLKKPEDFLQKVHQSKVRFSKLTQVTMVPVILVLQNKEIPYELNIRDRVSVLKAKLVQTVQEFKKYTPESINLQANGIFFHEDSLVETYAIENGAKIIVVVKKNLGCFKKDCLVSCAGGKTKPICEIKAGDTILSYSQQKGGLEEDKVTFVHKSIIKDWIVIRMEDGSQIETTANHLFLCRDEQYRMVQFSQQKEQTLKRGSILKLADGRQVAIESVIRKAECMGEAFYHLCIEKNHNFVVDNFIVHNLFVNIKLLSNEVLRKDVNPTQPIVQIKQQLEETYYTAMEYFKLIFAGRELNDERTLSDENISKDAYLNLVFKNADRFNYVNGDARVLTKSGLVAIGELSVGQDVLTYDVVEKKSSDAFGRIVKVEKITSKDYIELYLDQNKTPLLLVPDTYLELYSGEVVHAKSLTESSKNLQTFLKGIDGRRIRVTRVAAKKHPQSREYFKLSLDNAHNYVVQGAIVHDLVLNVAVVRQGKRERKLQFGAHLSSTIRWAKQRVQEYTEIPFDQLQFILNDKKLQDGEELLQYDIKSENLIVAVKVQSNLQMGMNNTMRTTQDLMQIFAQDYPEKKFYLVLSATEKIVIDYQKYADKTVQQIMKDLVPDCKSTYFFLFADLIIFPNQLLSTLEQSQNFYLPDNELIVVKNEKLAFIQNMSIKKSHIQNYSLIQFGGDIDSQNGRSQISVQKELEILPLFESAIARIVSNGGVQAQFKQEWFYLPFLYYTSHRYDRKIYQYIRYFEEHKDEVDQEDSVYSIIRNLYVNMNLLPNYIGECVCGMRNFRFSNFFDVNRVFYWHSFTSARRRDTKIVEDLKEESGTIFYINALAAKDIKTFSLRPEEGQILFPPFSYFLVTKIQQGKDMDRVWLDEIPSPITFQKNIILWVDDFPKNNTYEIQNILLIRDVEVLQLTSTIMAEKWVKEFGWLLNWRGLEFKLISDMGRFEGVERVQNSQAGIDLLQKLYKEYGFTAKTLVYCGNAHRATQLANERNLDQSKYYKITQDAKDVEKFCEIVNQ